MAGNILYFVCDVKMLTIFNERFKIFILQKE